LAFLNRKWLTATGLCLVFCLLGCSSGDLTSVSASLVENQRLANLTRTALSGLWQAELSTADGTGSQSFMLIFTQDAGFSLDGSLLVGEEIRLGGTVSSDTFAVVNGVFSDNEVRFNIAPSDNGIIVMAEGGPVLFFGLLTENTFMSGEVRASKNLIGFWEAVFSAEIPPAGGGGEGEGETP